MDSEALAEEFKLDITALPNDRYREIVFKPSPYHDEKQERCVVMWSRAHKLANNVYLYQALRGNYRVVKRVALPGRDEDRSELSVIGLLKKATEAHNQEYFVNFEGWFLNHEHIYFMMEYCPHGDISCCFPDPPSESEAHSICRQLLSALKFLHDLGIVHRDIKPKDVLVAQKYPIQVKLADFGISKTLDNTEPKTQIGTSGYMAPEIFPGLLECTQERSRYTYSSAVDIWALGCLLYSVLTGHSPFPGPSYLPLGDYANGRTGFPENPLLERGVSLAGRSFIFKLMSPLPERRPKATVSLLDDWVIPLKPAELPKRPEPNKNPELLLKEGQIMPLPRTTYGVPQMKAQSSEKQNSYPLNSTVTDRALPQTGKVVSRANEVHHSLQLWGLFERADRSEDGNEHALIHLESGANPDFIYNGLSLLLLSLSKPTSWMDTLLEHGANPQIQDKDGRSLIHSIVEISSSVPKHTQIQAARDTIVKLRKLTAYGASLDAYDSKGLTPVSYASTLGNEEMVKVLVSEGANINAKCHLGRTPLIYASTLRNLQMAKCLVELGASVNARCHVGRTSLIYACMPTNVSTRAISPKMEDAEGNKFARFLVETGADVNIRCGLGRTALHYVSDTKRHEPAMLFLEQGADVNCRDNNGRTPLHCAAKIPGNDLLVKVLIQSGVEINQKINGSVTALEIASKLDEYNGPVIKCLVKAGAECGMEDPIVKRRVLRAQKWLKITGQL